MGKWSKSKPAQMHMYENSLDDMIGIGKHRKS